MRKFIFSILSAALFTQPSMGRQLSPEEAFAMNVGRDSKIAIAGSRISKAVYSTPSLEYTVETDDMNTVYVFSKNGGGYWVVAADDAVPNGLLGYADSGEFNAADMPDNMRWMLEEYGKQVAYAANLESTHGINSESLGAHECESVERPCIKPILTTKWGQSNPYNTMCPVVDGQNCPTGCVATAMAQVMSVHRYPSAGIGSKSYKAGKINQTVSFDFASNPFDWDAIAAAGPEASDADASEVAKLMFACGVSVGMNYSLSASSSNYLTASRSLVNVFGYDKGVACLNREWFDDKGWLEVVYSELAAGRPVLYSGTSETDGGHAFVCDGYDCSDYFHINWGWKGGHNGYFLLAALDHRQCGTGFSHKESIIVGIQPPVQGSEVRPVFKFNGDMSIAESTVTRTANTSVTLKCSKGIFNQSVGTAVGYFGFKFVNTSTGEVQYAYNIQKRSFVAGAALVNYTVSTKNFPTEGKWYVIPAIKTESGKWYECCIDRAYKYAYVMTVNGNQLDFVPQSEAIHNSLVNVVEVEEIVLPSKMTYTLGMEIETKVKNRSGYISNKIFTPVLKHNGNTVATGTEMTFDVDGNSTESVKWYSYWQNHVNAGTYQVILVNRYGEQVSNEVELEVENVTTSGIDAIETDADADNMTTDVYTVSGQFVVSYRGTVCPDLQSGIYIMRHRHADGSVESEKVAI